jgi:hypothetical protein
MSSLNITNVINVSVATPPAGVAAVQVNNLAIFTKETPVNVAITAAAPGIYTTPSAVLTDWGSASEVYAMANLIFGQSPNILTGGGLLVIFPMSSGDLLKDVIPAGQIVQFFAGALHAGYAPNDAELIAAATACETARVKLFASSHLTASLTPSTGVFAIIHAANQPHTRKLLYTYGATAGNARLFAAAYAGRAMSVDFTGSLTTTTLHLKQLVSVVVDPGITQATLTTCGTTGVDVYVPIQGRASIFTSGADSFFDAVYNVDWLVYAITTAGFNALATTSTKLPQTEPGMAVLRGAYINVLKQAVTNGYIAPGAWNSSELFGKPVDLIRNILEIGWYIYSAPVNQQNQADRVARKAPLCQIAVKEAGAIHSSSVIIYINP